MAATSDKEHVNHVEASVVQSPHRLELTSTDQGKRYVHRFDITPIDGGSRITRTVEPQPSGFLRLIFPLGLRAVHQA